MRKTVWRLRNRFAENRFIGVNCGIMDQFASAMGKSGSAILLDSATLAYSYVPFPEKEAALIIVNSGVKHALASSAYNDRRRECETALADINKVINASSLCALSVDEFERYKDSISHPVCQKRARHAVYENRRTVQAADALQKGDPAAFGRLMRESHLSLQNDYAVSCPELDFLAETAWRFDGVYGARMTGGGFGGCTVNLVKKDRVASFIGSNADLPIVGGSILSHDHFQGGRYTFPMERAEIGERFTLDGFEDIECGIIKWPMSVIRIRGERSARLVELAVHILEAWRGYTDEAATVFAETNGEPHNTITPIARRRGALFELDLCLRNNLTTERYPMGLYHPHPERHHIKKENIGLIEVMGLAVLPARLNRELSVLEELIAEGGDLRQREETAKHADWAEGFAKQLKGKPREEIRSALEREVGKVFVSVLEDAGVFRRDESGREAFRRFIKTLQGAKRDRL